MKEETKKMIARIWLWGLFWSMIGVVALAVLGLFGLAIYEWVALGKPTGCIVLGICCAFVGFCLMTAWATGKV